jgi:hypothetical protein
MLRHARQRTSNRQAQLIRQAVSRTGCKSASPKHHFPRREDPPHTRARIETLRFTETAKHRAISVDPSAGWLRHHTGLTIIAIERTVADALCLPPINALFIGMPNAEQRRILKVPSDKH